jgi:hypothetical protein
MCEISVALGFILSMDPLFRIPSLLTSSCILVMFLSIGIIFWTELNIFDVSSEKRKNIYIWLRCKSAICRLNNDYVVCDAFDANRY